MSYSHNDDGGFQKFMLEQDYPPTIMKGTPKVDRLSAEAWSFAPHVVTSEIMTYLWSDPYWSPAAGNLQAHCQDKLIQRLQLSVPVIHQKPRRPTTVLLRFHYHC